MPSVECPSNPDSMPRRQQMLYTALSRASTRTDPILQLASCFFSFSFLSLYFALNYPLKTSILPYSRPKACQYLTLTNKPKQPPSWVVSSSLEVTSKCECWILVLKLAEASHISWYLPPSKSGTDTALFVRNGTISSIKEIVHNLSTAKLGMFNAPPSSHFPCPDSFSWP